MTDAICGFQQFGLAMKDPKHIMTKLLWAGEDTGFTTDTLVAIDEWVQ